METITISLDLFERLVTGAKNLSKGYRLNDQQRTAWRAIVTEAEAAQQSAQRTVVQACGCPLDVVHYGDGEAPCGL